MSYNAKQIIMFDPIDSTMSEVINSFNRFWLPLHSYQDELVLHHYTTLEGLKGILQTKSLWCTDTSSLGDPMELKYGKNLIINKLNEKIEIEENEAIKKILENLITSLEAFDSFIFRVFIACFCKEDNLLSQWRAYSGKGVGYNIGFRFETDTMFSHTQENPLEKRHAFLRKIIYDSEIQNEIISNSITHIIEEAKRVEEQLLNNGGLPTGWPLQAALEAVNILIDINMSFKNAVFEEEKEWRLIEVIDPNRLSELLQFRDINERLTPYLSTVIYDEIEGNNFCPISKIRIGPGIDEKRTRENLELFVKNIAAGSKNVKIDAADISFESAGYVLRS